MTTEEINTEVGRRLAERRKALGLSLAQVSRKCGVSLQQVHKYETGQSGLSVAKLVHLSFCLGVSPSYFLETISVAA